MSCLRASALTRAAILTALIAPSLSACANDRNHIVDDWYYLGDSRNPVPRAGGHKTNPDPEPLGFSGVKIADASTSSMGAAGSIGSLGSRLRDGGAADPCDLESAVPMRYSKCSSDTGSSLSMTTRKR